MIIDRIVATTCGGIVGVSFGVVVIFGQLQSSYFATFLTICGVCGAGGANAGYAVAKSSKNKAKTISDSRKIDRAIGAISVKYALQANKEEVLVALEEVREEIINGNY